MTNPGARWLNRNASTNKIASTRGARGKASFIADVLAFVIGLSSCASVTFVGSIPGSEVLLIPLLPFLVLGHFRRAISGRLKHVYILLVIWLFGQIMTDLYRQTGSVEWMKGDAAILFMLLDIVGLAALVGGKTKRKAVFIVGLSAGSLLATKITPNFYFAEYPWKFGYAEGATSLVLIASSWFFARQKYAVVTLLFLGLAGVHLYFNYRSPVLFLVVTMGLILPTVPERIGRVKILPAKRSPWRIVVLVLLVLTAGAGAKVVTTGLAASGMLGEAAQEKNESQAGSELGLLVGARPEILVSSKAVFDSPLLGHGSYAKDLKYIEMVNDLLVETGAATPEDLEVNQQEVGLIPTHSHLMGAWVNAGILGAVFWIYVLGLTVRSMVKASLERPSLSPWYVYAGIAFVWAILFSPFGYTDRIWEGMVIVASSDLLAKPSRSQARRLSRTTTLSGRVVRNGLRA